MKAVVRLASGLGHRVWAAMVAVETDVGRQIDLERRLVLVRWLGIAFVAPALPLFDLEPARLVGAYAIVAFAAFYNLVIFIVLRRAPERLANGFLSVLADGLANAGFVLLVGGFGSPAYFLLFTVTISAAMRYGYGPSLAVASVFASLDFAERSVSAGVLSPPDSGFIIRTGFLLITAVLSGYLRERATQAQRLLERQLRATQRSRKELESLGRLGSSLVSTVDLQALRTISADWLLTTLHLRRVVVYGPSPNGNARTDPVVRTDPATPDGQAGAATADRPPQPRAPRFGGKPDSRPAVNALRVGGQEICRILLDPGPQHPWTPARWRLAEAGLADIAAAIGGGLQLARLRWVADHDALTDLWSVRRTHDELDRAYQRSRNLGRPLSVALFDIDDFKRVNDTHGHATGDELLRYVADEIRGSMPAGSVVGRTGGDEFLIGLPDTEKATAERIITATIAGIAEEGFRVPSGERIPVSLSYGLVASPVDSDRLSGLLGQVDARLYESRYASETREIALELDDAARHSGTSSYDVLVGLVTAIDRKDNYTGRHSEIVAAAATALAEASGLSNETCKAIRLGGLLHDVGKIGVPDSVLRKPGRLTESEMAAIRAHVTLGEAIVMHVPHQVEVQQAIAYHHERFDGAGYPRGLVGEGIPLIGRIMAVADAFAAMTADRPYRKGLATEAARREVRAHAGTQFDPALAQRFAGLDLQRFLTAPDAGGRRDRPVAVKIASGPTSPAPEATI